MKKIVIMIIPFMMILLAVACGNQNLNKNKIDSNEGHYSTGYGMPIQVKIDECGGMVLFDNGALYTFGAPNDMPLGRKDKDYHMTKILENVVCIEQGEDMAFAIDESGQLWGWCAENHCAWSGYELDVLPKILAKDVKAVAASDGIVVIKEDNSAWVWGNGRESCNSKEGFTKILDNVKQVDITSSFGIAIKNDNTMWIWGDFELANEDIITEVPMIYGSGIRYATVQHKAISYIDQEGYLNIDILGNEMQQDIASDVISCQYNSAVDNGFYLSNDGCLYVWGEENANGQLGTGITSREGEIQKIDFAEAKIILEGIINYDMTSYTSIALDENGYVYVWGQNMNHILGMDDTNTKAIPTVLYKP